MKRRDFSATLVGAFASYALVDCLFANVSNAAVLPTETHHWLLRLHELSKDVEQGGITPTMWQKGVAELYAGIQLKELLTLVDIETLVRNFDYPERGVNTRPLRLPRIKGLPKNTAFIRKIFGMKKNRAIIPHGHRNMVSCHYVLHGSFALKQFNKLAEDGSHMIIRPSIDGTVGVGSYSSISDEKDNIHWLKATSPVAFTFDVIVVDLLGKSWSVDNIDPFEAEKLPGNRLRVPKISVDGGLEKYG